MLKIFGDKTQELVVLSPFMGKDVFKLDVIRAVRNAINERMCIIPGTSYCSERKLEKLVNGDIREMTLVRNMFVRVTISADRYDREFVLRFYLSKIAKLCSALFGTDFHQFAKELDDEAHITVQETVADVL